MLKYLRKIKIPFLIFLILSILPLTLKHGSIAKAVDPASSLIQKKNTFSLTETFSIAHLLNCDKSIIYKDTSLRWPFGMVRENNEIVILNSFNTEIELIPNTSFFGFLPSKNGEMILEVLVLGKYHGYMSAYDLYFKFSEERTLLKEEIELLKSAEEKEKEKLAYQVEERENLRKNILKDRNRHELFIEDEELPRWLQNQKEDDETNFDKRSIFLTFNYFSLRGLKESNKSLLTTKQGRMFNLGIESKKKYSSLFKKIFNLKSSLFYLKDSGDGLNVKGVEVGFVTLLIKRVGSINLLGEGNIIYAPPWTTEIKGTNGLFEGSLYGFSLLVKNQLTIRRQSLIDLGIGYLSLYFPSMTFKKAGNTTNTSGLQNRKNFSTNNNSIYLYIGYGYKFD